MSRDRLIGAVALACLAVTVACQRPAEEAEIPVAQPAPSESRVVAAIATASQRVEADRESADSWGGLGAVFDAHGYYPEASVCYRQAMARARGDFRWTYFLAITLDREGAAQGEVESLFKRAVELESGYPPVHYRQGSAFLRHGELEPARRAFERTLELDPNSAVAHRQLGRVHLALGDLEAARRELELALKGGAEDESTHSALAQVYARLGLAEESRAAADAAARSTAAPGIADPVRLEVSSLGVSAFLASRRGQAALAAGRPKEAMELLLIKDEVSSSASNDYFLGLASARMGRLKKAEKYFRRALATAGHADASWQLGELLLTQGRRAEGLQLLREALVAGADVADVMHGVGVSLARLGELQEALTAFARAGYLDPRNATLETDWCGALLQLNRLDEALTHCERAVELDEASSPAHFHLGLVLDSSGRSGEAQRQYQRAVELDPASRAGEMLNRL